MAEVIDIDKRDGYTYDPIIKGYDTTFFKTTTGDAPAMSSTVLRFTSNAAASFLQHLYADIEFALNVPTAPSAGEAKVWGLRMPASDKLGAAYFEIAGAVFRCVTADDGGTTETTNVTFDGDWDGTVVYYRIVWEPGIVRFMVNGVVVATHTTRVPSNALPIRIVNGDADNTDLTYVAVRRAAAIV